MHPMNVVNAVRDAKEYVYPHFIGRETEAQIVITCPLLYGASEPGCEYSSIWFQSPVELQHDG